MIVYKDIFGKLKAIGYSTTKLRAKRLLSESTLTRIRRNESITIESLDIICNLLHCQPNEILEIQYDRLTEEEQDEAIRKRREDLKKENPYKYN